MSKPKNPDRIPNVFKLVFLLIMIGATLMIMKTAPKPEDLTRCAFNTGWTIERCQLELTR